MAPVGLVGNSISLPGSSKEGDRRLIYPCRDLFGREKTLISLFFFLLLWFWGYPTGMEEGRWPSCMLQLLEHLLVIVTSVMKAWSSLFALSLGLSLCIGVEGCKALFGEH